MLAMQYSIHLPNNYDPALIQKRVDERCALFDTLPGLAHKSFLYNNADKLYAPFYIWEDIHKSRNFLLDDLFKGVITTFSRPRVRTWAVVDMIYGNKDIVPQFAVREADTIPPEENLQEMVKRELEEQAELLKNEHLHFHALALDPDRWEIVRYSLWRNEECAVKLSADCIQTYDVLHVSEPTLKQ